MAIKQVVCTTCGETVNKARTYHIGGGKRACKTHEGVVAKRDELHAKGLEKAQKEKDRREFRKERNERLDTNMARPHCWLCGHAGLRQDVFFQRVLVEMEKARHIYGTFNPFDFSHPANKNLGGGERCILIIAKDKCPDLTRHLRPSMQSLPDLSGVYALCGECAHKHGVKDSLPKPHLEQLAAMSVIYETFMKPVVQKTAIQELAQNS